MATVSPGAALRIELPEQCLWQGASLLAASGQLPPLGCYHPDGGPA